MGPGEQSSLDPVQQPSPARVFSSKPRCEIWGVLNATPDSFSDGGRFVDLPAAFAHAQQMLAEGAHVIDVGGESSRPAGVVYGAGGGGVSPDEEIARVVPLIAGIRRDLGATVSIDTVKAPVAYRAIVAGASIVNDVSCGACPDLLRVVADTGVDIVLMHTRGRGEHTADNTRYQDVVAEVLFELRQAVSRARSSGVAQERIWIDPGIGFAKTAAQSMALLASIATFAASGHRVLVGPSRKSFIAALAPNHDGQAPSPTAREGGTAAAVTLAVMHGAHAIRVHDVAAMRQAVLIAEGARSQARSS